MKLTRVVGLIALLVMISFVVAEVVQAATPRPTGPAGRNGIRLSRAPKIVTPPGIDPVVPCARVNIVIAATRANPVIAGKRVDIVITLPGNDNVRSISALQFVVIPGAA